MKIIKMEAPVQHLITLIKLLYFHLNAKLGYFLLGYLVRKKEKN